MAMKAVWMGPSRGAKEVAGAPGVSLPGQLGCKSVVWPEVCSVPLFGPGVHGQEGPGCQRLPWGLVTPHL